MKFAAKTRCWLLVLLFFAISQGVRIRKRNARMKRRAATVTTVNTTVATATAVNMTAATATMVNTTAASIVPIPGYHAQVVSDIITSKIVKGDQPVHILGKMRIPSAWNIEQSQKYAEHPKKNPCVFFVLKLDSESERTWPNKEERDVFWTVMLPQYEVVQVQVYSMLIVGTVPFGHWGMMLTIRDPIVDLVLYAAVHRVQRAWECLSMSYCNHVEIAVFDTPEACKYALTTAILPMASKTTVSETEVVINDGPDLRTLNDMPTLKFEEVIEKAKSFMDGAVEGFSLATQNCRDFIRQMLIDLVVASPEQVHSKTNGLDSEITKLQAILHQFGWTGFQMKVAEPPKGSKQETRIGVVGKAADQPCVYFLPEGDVCMMESVVGEHCVVKSSNSGMRRCEPDCDSPVNQRGLFCNNFGVTSCFWLKDNKTEPAGMICKEEEFLDCEDT